MQRFIPLLVGIIFVGIGCFLFWKSGEDAKNCTVAAVATVVDYKEEVDTDSDSNGWLYYPIIEYKVGSETIRVTSSKSSSFKEYNINDKIDILYNPNKKEEYIIKGDNTTKIMSIVFIAIGGLVTLAGIYMAITGRALVIGQGPVTPVQE